LALVMAGVGLRPTYKEATREELLHWRYFYSLRNKRDDLYRYLKNMKDPVKAVEKYNNQIDKFLNNENIPPHIRQAAQKLMIKKLPKSIRRIK